jgi:hypothetical protein
MLQKYGYISGNGIAKLKNHIKPSKAQLIQYINDFYEIIPIQ